MSDVIASRSPVPEAVHPPAISLRETWPWALFALLSAVYISGATAHEEH